MGSVPLGDERQTGELSFSQPHVDTARRRQSASQKKVSPGTAPTCTLTLDFQLPEL